MRCSARPARAAGRSGSGERSEQRNKASFVNKQAESHKGFIFYLHEVELLYNDVHHSQLTL